MNWDDWAGHYTYNVKWHGIEVTVECDSESDGEGLIMLPCQVIAGGVYITALVDIDDGALAEAVQTAHERR